MKNFGDIKMQGATIKNKKKQYVHLLNKATNTLSTSFSHPALIFRDNSFIKVLLLFTQVKAF
jgi:hypothetical protein